MPIVLLTIIFTFCVVRAIFCYDSDSFLSANDDLFRHISSKNNRILHRPISSPLNVSVLLEYAKLIQLNENEQTMDILMEYKLIWTDETLAWDRANFSDIGFLVVPRSTIYVPDIVPYNVKKTENIIPDENNNAKVFSNGRIEYYSILVTTVICAIQVQMFPFDQQTCKLGVTSFTLNETDMIYTASSLADISQIGNGEWQVTQLFVSTPSFVDNTNITYADAIFQITIVRRPIYYIAVVVVPTFLLSTVCILGLFGPKPESDIGPDKVPLSLATLMSMTVLLSIAAGTMPKNAMSLLGIYILLNIGLCALGALVSVLISFSRSVKMLLATRKCREIADENTKTKSELTLPDELNRCLKLIAQQHVKRIQLKEAKKVAKDDWSVLALKLNIFLVVVFESVDIAILIYMLNFWRTISV